MLGGGIIGAGFFGAQYLLSAQKWVGLGDVKLGALLGVMLGWQFTVLTLALAYIIGGIIATILLLTKQKKIGDMLPMGSFLAGAAIVVLLVGNLILSGVYLSAI
ncbi:MAG: prepilin peptidase [Candidatus Parcubacteria bacterium]|nr:prepilin peptidase [Candidatus Parcubacteria bacterium]